uniref:Uncharacterized protein n=1 Tax=Branchiostoma floridae TaxID=7739 RepID=C3ZB04_BRAFL|eukprot:XP_002594030.1 hypothetical protein BRAFLDRAFT_68530 [Branchiostoma floridae]
MKNMPCIILDLTFEITNYMHKVIEHVQELGRSALLNDEEPEEAQVRPEVREDPEDELEAPGVDGQPQQGGGGHQQQEGVRHQQQEGVRHQQQGGVRRLQQGGVRHQQQEGVRHQQQGGVRRQQQGGVRRLQQGGVRLQQQGGVSFVARYNMIGRNLSPVDVWYPLYKLRRHQTETPDVGSSDHNSASRVTRAIVTMAEILEKADRDWDVSAPSGYHHKRDRTGDIDILIRQFRSVNALV